jgi:aminoglycoside phosphotransferase (APT) family kinase protein
MSQAESGFFEGLIAVIASKCGLKLQRWRFLAQGAISSAYKLQTTTGDWVLRLSSSGTANYEVDAAIRRRLWYQLEVRCIAEPLATGSDHGVYWSIDRFIRDVHPDHGNVPERACMELGALLAQIQALPVQGYGLLANDGRHLRGQATDVESGLRSRLVFAWPFDDAVAHPAAGALAPYLGTLERHRHAALAALSGPAVLNHSDLHGQQLVIWRKQLTGLLDFGDAVAGPGHWDLASFAFFHGWQQAQWVVHGYCSNSADRALLWRNAELFTLTLALHHWARGVNEGVHRRIAQAELMLMSLSKVSTTAPGVH